jgi:hypothetical protein
MKTKSVSNYKGTKTNNEVQHKTEFLDTKTYRIMFYWNYIRAIPKKMIYSIHDTVLNLG